MEAPAARRPGDDQGRAGRALPRGRRGRPGALRARPVRRLPLDRRRRAGLDDRDVRRAPARDRELALGRRAVLHPHRQAAAGRRRPSCGSSSSTPPRLGFRRSTATPEPNQLVVKLDPSTGDPARRSTRTAPTRPGRRRSSSTWSSPSEGGEGPTPVRGAAARRDGRRQHALHAPGRRRGDVADHAAAARRAAAGASRTRPASWGPEAADDARRRPRPLARALDRVMTRRQSRTTERAAAERGGAVAVPADRRLRVPLELPHRRARRAGRRDRLAVRARASTRRASSAACSTAQAGFFRFGAVRDQPSRRRARTSRARTCS